MVVDTIEALIEACGGPSGVTELTGVKPPGQSNWKSRGFIPAELFVIFEEALRAKGKSVDRDLFSFRTVAGAR